jgi:hypothetical protein
MEVSVDEIKEQNLSNDLDHDFWSGHIVSAQSFNGTNSDYCREHGLDRKRFSYFKRLLGFGKSRQRRRAFVELRAESPIVEKSFKMIESKKMLPDAKWLAEFAIAFISSLK